MATPRARTGAPDDEARLAAPGYSGQLPGGKPLPADMAFHVAEHLRHLRSSTSTGKKHAVPSEEIR